MKSKICFGCKKEKPFSDFYKHKRHLDGRSSQCKECGKKIGKIYYEQNKKKMLKKARKYRKQNVEKYKDYYKNHKKQSVEYELKRNYGLTVDDYNKMYNQQRGCCAICGIHQSKLKKALGVDHNHESGMLRQLLCPHCNWLLGDSKESVEILKSAIKYLEKHNA